MSEKQSQQAGEGRRVVFFDLDGTLHQEDMFGSFLRFLLRHLPLNLLLVVPLLPVVGLALLVMGRAARWPIERTAVVDHLWAFGGQVKGAGAAFCDLFPQ